MEYFIVEHGVMWDAILQVLETKVAEGVEVRFMYDGMGNLFTLPHGYESDAGEGIQCKILRRCVRLSRVTRITAITGKSV